MLISRSIRPLLLRFRESLTRQSPLILRRRPGSLLERQNRPNLPQRRRRRPIPIQTHHRAARLPLARRTLTPKHQMGPRGDSSHQSHHRLPRRWRGNRPLVLWPRRFHPSNIVPQSRRAAIARSVHDLGAAGRDFRVDDNARECEAAVCVPA